MHECEASLQAARHLANLRLSRHNNNHAYSSYRTTIEDNRSNAVLTSAAKKRKLLREGLIAELCATPMTALVVVADLVVCLQAKPVGSLTILPRFAGKLLFDLKRLVGRL